MKKPLQAILIAGEEMKGDVLEGRKKITIREGHREYAEGPVLIGCHLLNWATMKQVKSVRHTTIRELADDECKDDGFKDQEDTLYGLRKFYPQMDMDSAVTVVRWDDE